MCRLGTFLFNFRKTKLGGGGAKNSVIFLPEIKREIKNLRP